MVKVNCKENVWFKFISYEFLVAAQVAYGVYALQSLVPTVTSAADGIHGEGSLHPDGLAWDFRIWGLYDVRSVAEEICIKLQEIDYRYDVVFGDPKHLDHIHIEYDINKVKTV